MTTRLLLAASFAATLSYTVPAHAGPDAYIGEITTGGYNFCPRGSTRTDGQLLAINTNQALFSLVGTTFGGDGRTTFGLPDLRGRVTVGRGTLPGGSNYNLGQRGGVEQSTISVNQMASHSHTATIQTQTAAPDTPRPVGAAITAQPGNVFNNTVNPGPVGMQPNFMNPKTLYVVPTGGSQPVNNIQPVLAIQKCINLTGVFPSRN